MRTEPVHFDDRLTTVLEQPASDPLARAVRWRQLVDLVARSRGGLDPSEVRALEVIKADRDLVDEPLRIAAAVAIAGLALPFALVALFAADTVAVAEPVLGGARLEREQWLELHGVADAGVRGLIARLQPGLVELFPVQPEVKPAPFPDEAPGRIERLRRGEPRLRRLLPKALEPAAAPALFLWECKPSGVIDWVEGALRGPLIGRTIARGDEQDGVDEAVERAFAARAPFRDGLLTLAGDGVIAGRWRISGLPAFEPVDGSFVGYRGIALREDAALLPPSLEAALVDPDSLRELVHEIKTPLNAIIGFAEIIDGQLLGPADERYRVRAAEIVGEARLLLAAIDDLDFAARLQANRGQADLGQPGSGTDLAMLLERMVAGGKPARLDVRVAADRRCCALEPALAERLVSRFLDALGAAGAVGSVPCLRLDSGPGRCLLWAERGPTSVPGEMVGHFSLRLVRGLAQIAGGDLTVGEARIVLELPEL